MRTPTLRRPGRGAADELLKLVTKIQTTRPIQDDDPRWPDIAELVIAHRLAGLAHEHWELPREVKRTLRRERARLVQVHAVQERLLARVLKALRPLPVLLLKGAANEGLYASPELRPRSDTDLLVSHVHFGEAHARLLQLGLVHHPRTRHTREKSPVWHERTFLEENTGQSIDLHQGLLQPERMKLTADLLFADSRPALGRARHVRIPSIADSWLIGALSLAAKELAVPLVLAVDLALLSAQLEARVLAQRAKQVDLVRAAFLASSWLSHVTLAGRIVHAHYAVEWGIELTRHLRVPKALSMALDLIAGRYALDRQQPSRPARLVRKALFIDRATDAAWFALRTLSGQ
ncbi:MAG: nucleotidyltransferase family protein [Deltaproteobacteria bacterium]|nr:nucleotidyltransferase family protein [Deltaproteobacteria bacterium]